MEANLIQRLMAVMKCESCGEQYEAKNVNVLGHRDDLWFLRASCSLCHSQCLVAAVIKEGNLPDAVTDLTEGDLIKFKDAVAINADDIIDVHVFLQEFDGDFTHLFSRA